MLQKQRIETLYRYGRRRADNVYQRLRSVMYPPPQQRIFFLHLEKCGGTSVADAIRRRYLNWRIDDSRRFVHLDHEASVTAAEEQGTPTFAYREEILYYFLSQKGASFVTGHFQVSCRLLEAFDDTWAYVIMLRDPVERWISHYFFNRFKRDPHGSIDQSIEAYLETPRGTALGQDYVCLLTGSGTFGRQEPPEIPSTEQIDQAKHNLDRFHVVGCLEDLPAFASQLEHRLGIALDIGQKNKNPVSSSKKEQVVTPEIRERIRALCAPNIELYTYAQTPAEEKR